MRIPCGGPRRPLARSRAFLLITTIIITTLVVADRAAAGFPGLTAEEARKLDQLLAVTASPLVSPLAPRAPITLGPLAPLAGVEVKNDVPVAPLLIQVRDGDTLGLEALGIVVDAVVGEVATARDVPLARLADLARRPEVMRIQTPRRLFPMNDVSVPETRAPAAWDLGATGQGVLVGIIDTGIDVNHPDFRNADTTTRIKLLLDLSNPGNGPFRGTLFTEAQINAGITAPDVVGHGTHVAGTAAGGGMADSTFRGVAFESDLIIVNADRNGTGSFSEDDVVNSLAFIDSVATARGQPYVANLSLGGHAGAHDGTALQELAIDFLVRPGEPGKAIVVAAGNERSGPPRHAEGEVLTGDLPDGVELQFQVPTYDDQSGEQNDIVFINLWYEAFSSFAITVESPRGHTVGPFTPGQSTNGTATPDGLIGVFNAANGTSPQNGDYEAFVGLIDAVETAPPFSGTWTIRIAGDTGPFDAYIAFSTMGRGAGFQGPYATAEGFVSEPGTARNAITVGAYTTKNIWTDKDGFPHGVVATVGEASSFSNAGPTRDGRIKPELGAPGELIASCYSADAPPGSPASVYNPPPNQPPNFFILAGDRYAIQLGTSQATPHVTGAVALLFEQRPDWDIVEVKRSLAATARSDAFTGPVPNNIFGNGKLDIEAAVVAAAAGDSLPSGLPGDVSPQDGDGVVDLNDARLAIDFVLQRVTPTPDQELRADMNADRVLDVGDIVLLLLEVVGGPGVAPEPLLEPDGNTWLLPITIAADRTVVGAEIEVVCETPGCEPLASGVRAARDGVLALAASTDGTATAVRIVTLALEDRDLSGKDPAIILPFRAGGAEPRWRIAALRLVGAKGENIQGKATFGAAERLLPATFRVLPVAANPSTSPGPIAFDLPGPEARPVTVGIYDVTGRLMAKLAGGMREPGRHVITWDGQGANGRRLPAGVYWVRIGAGGEIASTRLTVVR